jgi:hypothetical protein
MLEKLRGQGIAIAALAIAIGGTSYAAVKLEANSVGKRQLKANSVVSSKVKDGSLLDDDFMAGQLPRGATGSQGPPGAGGATGIQGPPGRSALTTLQPGETVRGFVGGDYEASAAGGDWGATASFPIPATSAPTLAMVDGVTMLETCTGSTANPTAAPDTLCVYPDGAANPGLGTGSHFFALVNKFGFKVSWLPTGAGDTYFQGTYAMTQG